MKCDHCKEDKQLDRECPLYECLICTPCWHNLEGHYRSCPKYAEWNPLPKAPESSPPAPKKVKKPFSIFSPSGRVLLLFALVGSIFVATPDNPIMPNSPWWCGAVAGFCGALALFQLLIIVDEAEEAYELKRHIRSLK